MPYPKSPARRALDELLADGAWHDRENATRHIATRVPPGQATRAAERLRRNQRNRAGNTGAANPNLSHPRDDQAVGARDIARTAVANAIRYATVEQTTTPAGTVLIRKAP